MDIAHKVRFLGRPDAYPLQSQRVEVVETHLSFVFLTRDHCYKLKKPVCANGQDLRTRAARRRNCETEVRLNRRLAPDVYLDVVPLTAVAGNALNLDGPGEAVDWLVKMRRLPSARMLDRMIRDQTLEADHVRDVALLLARFYSKEKPVEMEPAAYRERLERGVRNDQEALCEPAYGLPADLVMKIAARQLEMLGQRAALFENRVREGRIIEVHGDLRPEHVCLERTPRIIDCLEFDRDLRLQDPVDELVFLGLECERLGAPEVRDVLLEVYGQLIDDAPHEDLLRFYRSYRAGGVHGGLNVLNSGPESGRPACKSGCVG